MAATKTNKKRKLLLYLCFACSCVTVILFRLTDGRNGKNRYTFVDDSLRLFQIDRHQPYDSTTNNSTVAPVLQQVSHAPPPVYSILIVSIADWRKDMNTLPRTVTCEDSQSLAILKKVNFSNLYQLRHADYLIFTSIMRNQKMWGKLHSNRNKDQLWVFSTAESGFSVRGALPPMNYIRYNITATFHPRADIYVPFGKFEPWNLDPEKESMAAFVSNLYHQKQKLAVWVSSHCTTQMWRRFDFVHDLAKLIPVDMYGDCGQLSCPKLDNCTDIFSRYKFFIAFENTCCGGYITEKFWEALGTFHAIPIVVGAKKSDYLEQAPPNSFLHVDDFHSMSDLATYIQKIAENKELYDNYIKWKVDGYVLQNSVREIYTDSDAGVCRLLNYKKRHQGKMMTFDPYGPRWLGGCFQCGKHSWIKNYSNWHDKMAKTLLT